MPLIDCLVKSGLSEQEQKFIIARSRVHIGSGLPENEAAIKAVKEFQNDTLHSLADVFDQLGMKGLKPEETKSNISVIRPNQNNAPNIIQLKNQGEQNAIPIGGSEAVSVDAPPTNSGEVGEGIPPSKEPSQTQSTEATGEEPEKITGIKKAISEGTRFERNLPKVEVPKMGKDAEELQKGKELVDSGKVNPREVVDRVISEKGIYSPDEARAMQYYAHQLATQEKHLSEVMNESPKDSEDHILAGQQLNQLMDEVDRQTQSDRINSNSWGTTGNIMQIEADPTFRPSLVRNFVREAYGGEIPTSVKEKMDAAFKERDDAIAELKKAKEDAALQALKKDSAYEQRKGKRKQTKEELKKERDDLKEQLKKIKEDEDKKGYTKMGIGVPNAMIPVIGKLALNYFKDGIVTLEDIADKIQHDLEGAFSKKEVFAAVSSYGQLREEAHDKKVKQLETKATSIENQVATGNVKTEPGKANIVFKKTNGMLQAEAKVIRAEHKLKVMKINALESQKSNAAKVQDWILRWERRLLLLSSNVFVKLTAAAAIGSTIYRIPKEIVGFVWSKAFQQLADKAIVEGNFNAKSFGKYYSEVIDPKKFLEDSQQIVKTGSSDLAKKLDLKPYKHYPLWDLLTQDAHSIIKAPVKRAAYESALVRYYAAAEQQGLDVNDPLVQAALQFKAYKVGQYEIFQEENGLGKWFNAQLEKAKKSGEGGYVAATIGRFLVPINNVPLNIARRLGLSITGLPRGLYNVAKAYRKGIENLSEEDADAIMRQLKFGSLGMGLFMLGAMAYKNNFGGVYNKTTAKNNGDDGIKHDEMNMLGVPIPKGVQHALPFEIIQFGATFARVYDHYHAKGETDWTSLVNAAGATTGAAIEQIPMLNEGAHVYEAVTEPNTAKQLGKDLGRRVGLDKIETIKNVITGQTPESDTKKTPRPAKPKRHKKS